MQQPKSFFEKLKALMETSGVEKKFSKGNMLIREGEVEKNLYHVTSGLIRVFLLSEFEEQTIRFGYQGSIINSLSSFITGKPSEFYMDAIRKTTVRAVTREQLLGLVNKSDENRQQYIQTIELAVTQQVEREVDILTVSPQARLKRVLERSPNLFQEVPLKYIASYLRMTPETLSRIRNS